MSTTPRTLALCFDGTGDSIDDHCTNVAQFKDALTVDETKQLITYQAGIGTSTNNKIKTPIRENMTKMRDQIFAFSLGDHVKGGYEFLMKNYRPGDKICLFGFSRGAFTARALAGMVQKVGLLREGHFDQLESAYDNYVDESEKGLQESLKFKKEHSSDVPIYLVGVWDTVESVGLLEKRLPFCVSKNAIKYFRHAVSLDECRVKFTATYFHGVSQHQKPGSAALDPGNREDTNVKEVFFAGVHCDVGGGAVPNDERHALARISLRWMIRECFLVDTGIVFDAHKLEHVIGLDMNGSAPVLDAPEVPPPATLRLVKNDVKGWGAWALDKLATPYRWWVGKPPVGPRTSEGETQEELDDTASPINDQVNVPHWTIMQYLPVVVRSGCGDKGGWKVNWFGSDLSEGREMDEGVTARRVKVHRSVKNRIMAKGPNGENPEYLPEIRFLIGTEHRHLTREEWLAEKPVYFDWVK